jgi:uncharacterized phage protein (predicted DNA packaging)
MIIIDQIKEYSRIDADDITLQMMIDSASSHFESKGVKEEYLTNPKDVERLKLGMLMLVDHWYNNRGAFSEKDLKTIPLGVNSIIFSLQMICKKNRELIANE